MIGSTGTAVTSNDNAVTRSKDIYMRIFWDITKCSQAKVDRHFFGAE
jgi:hypothetical protein